MKLKLYYVLTVVVIVKKPIDAHDRPFELTSSRPSSKKNNLLISPLLPGQWGEL